MLKITEEKSFKIDELIWEMESLRVKWAHVSVHIDFFFLYAAKFKDYLASLTQIFSSELSSKIFINKNSQEEDFSLPWAMKNHRETKNRRGI